MMKLEKRERIIVGLVLGVLAVVAVLWRAGYGPEIGKFFAYEQPSGYVPYCTGYGQMVTYDDNGQQFPSCCAGLAPWTFPESEEDSVAGSANNDEGRSLTAVCIPPECSAIYEQHECFTTPCEPVLNVICPTELPNPEATAELYINGDGAPMPVLPGQHLSVPVTLNTNGAKVTAVDFGFQADGYGWFTAISYGTPDFPEVLDKGTITEQSITAAVGSGPSGGRSGDNLAVASLAVDIAPDAPIGSTFRIFTLNAEIAAEGAYGSVLRYGGYADFIVVAKSAKIGDIDGDGDVDIYDYNLLVSNFGK